MYVCPQHFLEIFNVHAWLFSTFVLQVVLFYEFPEYLAKNIG